MQTQKIQKVVSEVKNDSPLNKTLFLVALATFAVLALTVQQKAQDQADEMKYSTAHYVIEQAPQTSPIEE